MPELPEVERLRRELAAHLIGLRIRRVLVRRREVIVGPGDPPGGWSRTGPKQKRPDSTPRTLAPPKRLRRALLLDGATVAAVERHGKQLAIVAEDTRALGVHLGMTGAMLTAEPGSRAGADHVHVVWWLERQGGDAGRLLFRDPRRFGGIWAVGTLAELEALRWSALGPDALTIDGPTLSRRLGGRDRPIKAALLDQGTLAGVGNIYADESLFRAGIRPDRLCGTVTPTEADRLAAAIREVLAEAVEAGGSSLRDYVGADGVGGSFQLRHRVYGRSGQGCQGCGTALETRQIAQRTTVFCPACQV